MLLPKVVRYKGKADSAKKEILPVGLCRVMTKGQLGFAYVSVDGEVTDMFSLDPGKHRVKFPGDRHVIVQCDDDVEWSVQWPGIFNPSDPTRVEASLVRPLSPQEEMQAYVNELAARTMAEKDAAALRSGNAELDTSDDDYSEDAPEDDMVALPSTHQLQFMMDEIAADLLEARRIEAEEKKKESLPIDPLLPPGGPGAPAPDNESDS